MDRNQNLGVLQAAIQCLVTGGTVALALAALTAAFNGLFGALSLADGLFVKFARPELLAGAF